jgi:ATP synthase protein I
MSDAASTGSVPAPEPAPDAPHVRTVLRLAAAMQRHALLLAVPVAVAAVGLATVLRGTPGLVGAVIGALLGLVAGAVSTLVMRGTARTSPAGVMIGAMASFAGKVLLLMLFLVAFRGTTLFDNRAFGLTLLAVTVAWIAGEVVGFVRARPPVLDI